MRNKLKTPPKTTCHLYLLDNALPSPSCFHRSPVVRRHVAHLPALPLYADEDLPRLAVVDQHQHEARQGANQGDHEGNNGDGARGAQFGNAAGKLIGFPQAKVENALFNYEKCGQTSLNFQNHFSRESIERKVRRIYRLCKIFKSLDFASCTCKKIFLFQLFKCQVWLR